MHGVDGIRKYSADLCGLGGREGAASPNFLLKRFAFDELHPQASQAIKTIGAMNRHNIRMSHTAEEMSFSDEGRTIRFDIAARSQQLQGDIASQPWVTSTIDVPVRTRPNEFNDFKVAPITSGWQSVGNDWKIGADVSIRRGIVRTSNRIDLLEYLDEIRGQVPSLRFGFPVDRLAVGQAQGKRDKGIVRHRTLRIR